MICGYTIYRPDHWALAGLDLYWGDVIGDALPLIGYENDGCAIGFDDDGLPVAVPRLGVPAALAGRGNTVEHTLLPLSIGPAGLVEPLLHMLVEPLWYGIKCRPCVNGEAVKCGKRKGVTPHPPLSHRFPIFADSGWRS